MPNSEPARMGDRHSADRATKAEVLARLDEAHVALIGAADAMARRYGSSDRVKQICGAAALITTDWMPTIMAEKDA